MVTATTVRSKDCQRPPTKAKNVRMKLGTIRDETGGTSRKKKFKQKIIIIR